MLHRTDRSTPVRSRLLVGGLLALLAVTLLGPVASAYIDQAPFQILLSGPGRVVRCDRSVTISATVLSATDGKPVRKQVIAWAIAQSQSSGDRLSASRTTTNSEGRTSVNLSFGPVAGARRVSASATIVSPTIEVRCAGGLPATLALPRAGGQPSLGVLARVAAPIVPDAAMGLVDPGVPATRLRIGRLGMDVPIVAGNGVDVPEEAAAHFPGTAWPGAGSNTFLYAHRRDGLFGALWRVRTGDLVTVSLADGAVATYRVSQIRPVVAWDDLEPLAPTGTERITLQTCLTDAPDAPRLVVVAERVSLPTDAPLR